MLALSWACATSPQSPQRRALKPPAAASRAEPKSPGLSATELFRVEGGTFGPYIGGRTEGALVVWAVPDGQRRRWSTLGLDAAGRPLGKRAEIADAPRELGLVSVRSARRAFGQSPSPAPASPTDSGDGFVIVSTRRGTDERVEVLLVDERGGLKSGPTSVGSPGGEILWVESIPTELGSLVLWSVHRAGRAELFVQPIDARGEKLGEPRSPVRGARAWQATELGGGVALAAITGGKPTEATGAVELHRLDARGDARMKPIVVSPEPSAELDLDMLRIGSRLLLAWSDRRGIEPRVFVALLDEQGAVVRAPAPVSEPFGEQALVRLVPGFRADSGAFLVWEDLLERPRSGRALKVAKVLPDGSLGAARGEITMASEDGSIPEFHATSSGVAALTLAPACLKKTPCEQAERLPTYVELGKEFELAASEPLRLSVLGGAGSSLAWGLHCTSKNCFSLAATATAPSPIFSVELAAGSSAFEPAARPLRPGARPRVRAVEAVASLDPISDAVAARVDDQALLAWVTYFDPTAPWQRLTKPAPDGRFDPLRALLQFRVVGGSGAAAPQTISLRAHSIGGVALAAGDAARKEALLAWAAVDNKQPQVFVTALDKAGKKLGQKMITRRSGELSDVAVAFAADGYLVSWIDERHGDPELYAAKLNRLLQRAGPERRLTSSQGAATAVALLSRGANVFSVWADARDTENPGWADIYALRLRSLDAAPDGAELLLARTRLHSHSPALASFGAGAIVAWVEHEPGTSDGGQGAGIYLAELDGALKLVGKPTLVPVRGAVPTSVALECSETRCRVVTSVELGGRSELRACEWQRGSTPQLSRLVGLTATSAQSVSPSLVSGELYYADLAQSRGIVRRALIDWQ